MTIHGENCFLTYRNALGKWVVFGGERQCAVEMDTEMIEVSSENSGVARTYLPGKTGWRMTFGGLLMKSVDIVDLWQARTPITVRFNYDGKILEGEGYITKLGKQSELHGMAQRSMTIQGSGKLEKSSL